MVVIFAICLNWVRFWLIYAVQSMSLKPSLYLHMSKVKELTWLKETIKQI